MTARDEQARRFLELHVPGEPLVMPNAWDAGSARVLASLGFEALATTSSGFAATLGRADGGVTRDEVLAHCAALAAATELPVSADLESGFAAEPDAVAETVRLALGTGLAGCSIEDYAGDPDAPLFPVEAAAARVAAAADAAHAGDGRLVLTARAENFFRGPRDLGDAVRRLQAYQEAGADVLFAPGLRKLEDVARVVAEVDLPVSVLVVPGMPTVPELAQAGVARISVGGGFALAALGTLVQAAQELIDTGTYTVSESAASAIGAARAALR